MSELDTIRIPVLGAQAVSLRLSPLPRTGPLDPSSWRREPLRGPGEAGEWWEIDLSALGLPDGAYEYDVLVERGGQPSFAVPDPYAEEITRFGGYRGVFRCMGGHRYRLPFSWAGELPEGVRLPDNREIVVYELPLRWVDAPPEAQYRQVGLGTFDEAIYERLGYLQELGINTIELLPIQDSPDTLNWGYGTRFFFAPDIDMGEAADLKALIRECHRRGMRVILDVVMNHARECPLQELAYDMFFLRSGDEERDSSGEPRNDWGGKLFRYREPRYGGFHARDFHLGVARYWIQEFHVDGFRIDEFKGIDNWDFIRAFRDNAWEVHQASFPGRPFIVIAEDSWRRAYITRDLGRGPTVDAMWDFDFRDEVRRLVTNRIPGQPTPRSERVRALLTGSRQWDDMGKRWRQRPDGGGGWVDDGFQELTQRVIYNASHDVEKQWEQRLFPFLVEQIASESPPPPTPAHVFAGMQRALEQAHASFALMLTAAGIPMFLAGEEFADLHDIPHDDWRLKMSDTVDWQRATAAGHRDLLGRVRELLWLRRRHSALQRDELLFFGLGGNPGFHPDFDGDPGERVLAYCRTRGQPLGSPGQVVVVANCGEHDFPSFGLGWPWGAAPMHESGGAGQPLPAVSGSWATLALRPFQVRVFWS